VGLHVETVRKRSQKRESVCGLGISSGAGAFAKSGKEGNTTELAMVEVTDLETLTFNMTQA